MTRSIAVLTGLAALAGTIVCAGGWSHQLTSPNGSTATYGTSVSVPAAAAVQQGAMVFNIETVAVNNGPLGGLQANNPNYPQSATGNIASGTYSIYQAVVRGGGMMSASGLCYTTISW